MGGWDLRFPEALWQQLRQHLFPGDGDEHGAVVGASVVESARGTRLLACTLHLAVDGVDYVPGQRSYRMLTPAFVRDSVLACRDEGLAYLAIHCHGGRDTVGFSPPDLASHERGYPALRDIAGQVVGAVVFATNAAAGDLWLPDGHRVALTRATIVGRVIRTLYPTPPTPPIPDPTYDRQARLFGDRGQALLQNQKVGVIGVGGAGSLIVEYLARLGVGHLVVVDPDRVETSNLPRIVGSSRRDALPWLTADQRPAFVRRLARRFTRPKVSVARRVARQANPRIVVEEICGDIVDDAVAQRLTDCDYLFLAADPMQTRLMFNALVHQYGIPGTQVGAKVRVDLDSGEILDVYSVVRPVSPGSGCLWCNGLISPARLQDEALSAAERARQHYVDDSTVTVPSVITLNAVAAAHAVDDYLFRVTGLLDEDVPHRYLRFLPREVDVCFETPRRDPSCSECGAGPQGRLSRGQQRRLPTR